MKMKRVTYKFIYGFLNTSIGGLLEAKIVGESRGY